MTRKQKRYSKAFKLETIELSRTSGKSDSQLEEELGLGRGCLYIGAHNSSEMVSKPFQAKVA